MKRRALLASLGAALGLAGCSSSTDPADTPERTPSKPVDRTPTATSPRDTRTDRETATPTETADQTPTADDGTELYGPINLRIFTETEFRDDFYGTMPPDGHRWLVVRYTVRSYGGKTIGIAPSDFVWTGGPRTSPSGPIPHTSREEPEEYDVADVVQPGQSATRGMTFAVPNDASSTSLALDLDYYGQVQWGYKDHREWPICHRSQYVCDQQDQSREDTPVQTGER